ncbi:hypothetical protein TNCV_2447141 [Trichonephila clavipes]|uniref:Uncharacterized protein n=1 Tax=Trichonephila clavipes TaxID=2585209 RepID=A0A8X6SJD9_TRICX|nr:hypothetical protein TNCV_2447141 [Trichonephila clavipes]
MHENGGNCFVPDPDYMEDALKFPNRAPRVSGESLHTREWLGVVLMEHNTSSVGPILAVSGQSLASNGPAIDIRYMNLEFGHTKATHNKLLLSSPTNYEVEPSWP